MFLFLHFMFLSVTYYLSGMTGMEKFYVSCCVTSSGVVYDQLVLSSAFLDHDSVKIIFFLWIHDSCVMCFHDGNVGTALLLDIYMVISWHGNTCCVTMPLGGKHPATSGCPSQRVINAELWRFLCYQPKQVLNKLWVATDLKLREVDTHVMSL